MFPIHPRATPGKDNYAFWEDFLTDADINYILSLPEWGASDKALIGGSGLDSAYNPIVRETTVSWWNPSPANTHIWSKFSNVFSEINRQYFRFDLTGMHEPAQLGLYTEDTNGHYDWHTDAAVSDTKVPRKLSMALLLTDPLEFEGGELQLKVSNDNPISVQQKRGRAWFFPSYVLHKVTPVTKGNRKSLVLWAGGPEFR